MRLLAFAASISAVLSSPVVAEDDILRVPLRTPPTFDLGYEMFDADIIGLKLGQSVEDANAALEARGCDSVERDVSVIKSYASEDNVRIEYVGDDSYVQTLTCELAKDDADERYEVIFTTNFTGNVAMSVRREVRYDPEGEPITAESFANAVVQKYGKPRGQRQHEFIWIHENSSGDPEKLNVSISIARDVVTQASFTLDSNRLSRRNLNDITAIEKKARALAKEFAEKRRNGIKGKGKAPEL